MTMTGGFRSAPPLVGERVVTADGDELGMVKEVSGNCFKIDASMQPDYWLSSDCIAAETGSEVRLTFTKDRLGDAKVDGPEHTGMHRHMNGG